LSSPVRPRFQVSTNRRLRSATARRCAPRRSHTAPQSEDGCTDHRTRRACDQGLNLRSTYRGNASDQSFQSGKSVSRKSREILCDVNGDAYLIEALVESFFKVIFQVLSKASSADLLTAYQFDADSPTRSNSASDGIFIRDKCERVDACADFKGRRDSREAGRRQCWVLIRFRQTENRCL
jgi:hypothetical protein